MTKRYVDLPSNRDGAQSRHGAPLLLAFLLKFLLQRQSPRACYSLSHGTQPRMAGMLCCGGLISVLFASLLPIGYVLLCVRRQKPSDRHVSVRRQRRIPLIVSTGFVLIGLIVLRLGGAPSALVALVAAMAAGLATSLLVTLFWKVSVHAAVVAGSEAILVLVFGPWLLAVTPVVILVGWARLQLRQHTLAQVIAGIALGAVVATSVFSTLAKL